MNSRTTLEIADKQILFRSYMKLHPPLPHTLTHLTAPPPPLPAPSVNSLRFAFLLNSTKLGLKKLRERRESLKMQTSLSTLYPASRTLKEELVCQETV